MNRVGPGPFLRSYGILIAVVAVVLVFSLIHPSFLTGRNLANIGRQTTLLALISFAMTFVIISGEIDISIGAVTSIAAVAVAFALNAGWPWGLAVFCALLLGAAIGAVNGMITVFARIPSFIVTVGTLNIVRGLTLAWTNASTITFHHEAFRVIFARGRAFGVPAPVWFIVILFAFLYVLLHRSRLGADIFAVGGNAESARLAGIAAARVRVAVFALSGAVAASAAIIMVARVGNGQPEGAIGLELSAIAAVVIGGNSFSGGRGSLFRTVLGALLIGTLGNGLTLMNVDHDWQLAVRGVVILVAVFTDRLIRRGQSRG